MEKSHIKLSLARQDFRIVCTETPEHMKMLENSVNARIESIRKKYPNMSTMRLVLLAMLNMEDDLYKAGIEKADDDDKYGSNQYDELSDKRKLRNKEIKIRNMD